MTVPQRLTASFHPKVWGSSNLEPWYPGAAREAAAREEKIGEVWFTSDPRPPLLVKFIFTDERLSVQVHPGGDSGKTEMWHILRAGPQAAVAAGFTRPVSVEELREASLSGEVEHLLRWFPVRPGDTIFVPAGTVHAIGADLALCEIQQYSDTTYRLYDYGRPRELHLDQGLPLCELGTHEGPRRMESGNLVRCEYFSTDKVLVRGETEVWGDIVVILAGEGEVGGCVASAGQAWRLAGSTTLKGEMEVLVTGVP
jgi:mannose-6-phosphate isomerase